MASSSNKLRRGASRSFIDRIHGSGRSTEQTMIYNRYGWLTRATMGSIPDEKGNYVDSLDEKHLRVGRRAVKPTEIVEDVATRLKVYGGDVPAWRVVVSSFPVHRDDAMLSGYEEFIGEEKNGLLALPHQEIAEGFWGTTPIPNTANQLRRAFEIRDRMILMFSQMNPELEAEYVKRQDAFNAVVAKYGRKGKSGNLRGFGLQGRESRREYEYHQKLAHDIYIPEMETKLESMLTEAWPGEVKARNDLIKDIKKEPVLAVDLVNLDGVTLGTAALAMLARPPPPPPAEGVVEGDGDGFPATARVHFHASRRGEGDETS